MLQVKMKFAIRKTQGTPETARVEELKRKERWSEERKRIGRGVDNLLVTRYAPGNHLTPVVITGEGGKNAREADRGRSPTSRPVWNRLVASAASPPTAG